MFLCFINYSTLKTDRKDIGHFLKQNLFKDVHAVREKEPLGVDGFPCIFAVPDLWNSSPIIRKEPKQCMNTWQITEVPNSAKRHADNSGNYSDQ